MKKSFLNLLLLFFFLTIKNSFAQSFVSASENVTIKIVDRISITVSEKSKDNNDKKYFIKNFETANRNLLVFYDRIISNSQKSFSSLHLSTQSTNTTLTMGEQTELKHLSKDEHLHINIIEPSEFEELNTNHFVTIVF
jgi:hypothetical protein